MEKRDFYELAEANVRHYMPRKYQDAQFELVEMKRINDVKMTGLQLRLPGQNVTPIIYLDHYYEQYEKSGDAMSVVIRLANDMLSAMEKAKLDNVSMAAKTFLDSYERIRDKLEIRLCDLEENVEFLKAHPHTVIGDFAATYAIQFGDGATCSILNEHMDMYGVSVEQLHTDALEAETSRGITLHRMEELVGELMLCGEPPRNLLREQEDPSRAGTVPVEMYVLTNPQRKYGASAILHDDVLKKAGEIIGGDYVVLPSSVHEVILVPADEVNMTLAEIKQMIRDVNDTTVVPEERLSYKAQYYDMANERLTNYEEHEWERKMSPLKMTEYWGREEGFSEGFVPYALPQGYTKIGGDLPEDVQKHAYRLSVLKNVFYPVVLAVVEVESGYNPNAMKETGAVGYMQLIELWHEDAMKRLGCRNLEEPSENLLVGIDFLSRMLMAYDGDYRKALTAYRYGIEGAERHFFSNGETTCEYAEKVLETAGRIEKELDNTRQALVDEKKDEEMPEDRNEGELKKGLESGQDGKRAREKTQRAVTASAPRL